MKVRHLCTAALAALALMFLFIQTTGSKNARSPSVTANENLNAQPLASESESIKGASETIGKQRVPFTPTIEVQLVDLNTGVPISLTSVIAVQTEGSPENLNSNGEGWLELPKTTVSIEPQNGFTFLPTPCGDIKDQAQFPVQGQFQVTLTGAQTARCAVTDNRSPSAWLELLSNGEASDFDYATPTPGEGPLQTFTFPSRKSPICLFVPESTVSPGHTLWTGQVKKLPNGDNSASPPSMSGPAPISAAFQGHAGESVQFNVRQTAPLALITFITNRRGHFKGTVALLEEKALYQSGGTTRLHSAKRSIDCRISSSSFEDLPPEAGQKPRSIAFPVDLRRGMGQDHFCMR